MSDLPACYLIHKSGEWKLMAKKREKNLSAENRSPRLFPAVRTHTHPCKGLPLPWQHGLYGTSKDSVSLNLFPRVLLNPSNL